MKIDYSLKITSRLKILTEVLLLTFVVVLFYIFWPQPEPPLAGIYLPSHAKLEYSKDVDSDGDGLNDCHERQLGTDPFNTDSDGDGYCDDVELNNGFNPLLAPPPTQQPQK